MRFSFTVNITKKKWLDYPPQRWNAGLDAAGLNFRQLLQRAHYPPLPPRGSRTYQTADQASYNITEVGKEMEFGSTSYLPFLLGGTSKMRGWPGKWHELQTGMQAGFRAGVRDYRE